MAHFVSNLPYTNLNTKYVPDTMIPSNVKADRTTKSPANGSFFTLGLQIIWTIFVLGILPKQNISPVAANVAVALNLRPLLFLREQMTTE